MKLSRLLLTLALLVLLGLGLLLLCRTPTAHDPIVQAGVEAQRESEPQARTPMELPVVPSFAEARHQDVAATEAQQPAAAPPSSARLHVIDAASDAELDHVVLCRLVPFESATAVLPTKSQLSDCVGRKLASPILITQAGALATQESPATWFACTPAHAWGQIGIDPAAGGEHVLRLEPGGSLRVTLRGKDLDPGIKLSLWRMEETLQELLGQWHFGELGSSVQPTLDLEGLRTGAYRIRAQLDRGLEPRVLASRDFWIRTGERAEVALRIGETLAQQVELAIAIEFDGERAFDTFGFDELDSSWALDKFMLDVQALDSPVDAPAVLSIPSEEMNHALSGLYLCKTVKLASGMYRFTIADAKFDLRAWVGPNSGRALHLRVPAPGLVTVEVQDAETGALVIDATLEWLTQQPDARFNTAASHMIPELGPGRFEFRAPRGPLGLYARSRNYEHYPGRMHSIEVAKGTNPVRIELERGFCLILRLHEGERTTPWRREWLALVKFENADGDPVLPRREFDAGSGRFMLHFEQPGRYCLRSIKIPGCSEIPPMTTVEFDSLGSTTWLVDLPLVRE